MNNDIKDARGVKTGDGKVMRSICGRPTLYAKKRARTPNGGAGDARGGEAITKRIQLEMKQKGRVKDDGRDVLYIYVSELGMNY